MNPPAKCPVCGKTVMFHDEEMEDVADGSAACPDCRMRLTEDGYILGIAMGVEEPPDLEGVDDGEDDQ